MDSIPKQEHTNVVAERALATIIDTVVVFVLLVMALLPLGGVLAGIEDPVLVGYALAFLAFFVYFTVLEWVWDGYTVGKKAVGVRVVTEHGGECSFWDAVTRNVFRFVDGLFYYGVGLFLIATSDMRQRLGDQVAATVVVAEDEDAVSGTLLGPEDGEDEVTAAWDWEE